MVVVDEARWVELLVSQWWWQQQLLLSLGGLNTLNTLCSLNTQSVTIASITDNLLHFLHLLDGYGSNTIRFYYLHRGETKLLMYGGSSLIFSNYNAGMRSAVGRRDIIILTPHHLVSAEYSPKYPGEENIQISSLYASLVVCVVQDIFDLFSLNSAGERKNWAKCFRKMNCCNLAQSTELRPPSVSMKDAFYQHFLIGITQAEELCKVGSQHIGKPLCDWWRDLQVCCDWCRGRVSPGHLCSCHNDVRTWIAYK